MPAERILARLRGEPWAIQPEWLAKMIDIAERTDIQTLDVKTGEPFEHSYTATQRGSTAVIPIEGPIFPKANLMTEMSGATALSLVAKDFQAAQENEGIDNIVLKINSPGGNSTGIDEMASLIRSAEKPVHAHVSGVGASAAYWLAAQADSISVSPASSVGSLGVAYVSRRNGDQGETIEFVSSLSPKKRLSPETEEGEAEIMQLIDGMAEVFINDVAQGRNTSSEDVLTNYGQGGMLIAQKALEIGMVDRVGTFEELMADLSGQPTSSYGEYQMNIEELKAKHPDVYQAVFQLGVTSADEKHQEAVGKLEAANDELSQQNADLTSQLETQAQENQKLEDRVTGLEKNEAIRQEKAVQAQSKGIVKEALAQSDLPPRMHKRVKVDHEPFISDEGVLDVEGFTAAVKESITSWEEDLKEDSPVAGFGDSGTEASNDDGGTVDAAVDSLFRHITPKEV